MLESTQSETNQIPLVTLPMAFKQRLAQLAYIPDLKNLRKTCPEIKNLCRNGAREFEQLYLTDDDAHFQKAKFYICTLQYVEKNRTKIYISDTAVLYCVNSDSYDKIIPYICGPYTRISIRGEVRWDQVKRLMHPNVREIQILAKMDLRPDEYDEFAEFMEQHLRGKPYKFSFKFYTEYTLALAKKVQTVCRRKRTYYSYLYYNMCISIDRRSWRLQTVLLLTMCFGVLGIHSLWIVVTHVRLSYALSTFFFAAFWFYLLYALNAIAAASLPI